MCSSVPMAIICSATIVMVEAAGMMSRSNPRLPDEDKQQMMSASISRGSLAIVMLLTIGSHIVGMAAVFFQVSIVF